MRKFRDNKNKSWTSLVKKPDFTKQLVSENIYLLKYASHRKMCNALMRFDLFPEISEPMSVAEFKRHYKKRHGSFSFARDWEGFVIPSRAIEPFMDGSWNPLSTQEKLFLKTFKNIKKPFAVIAVSPLSSPTTLNHEMSHALYEVNLDYRREVSRVLESVDLKPIYKILKKNGYLESSFDDESHAYLMNNLNWLKKEGLRNISKYYEVCAKLNYLFDKYCNLL